MKILITTNLLINMELKNQLIVRLINLLGFMDLLHKSFYKFHENRIKKEEASVDADLDPEDGVISDIFCKIVTKIRSLFSLNKEEKKENEESKEHFLNHKNQTF